MSEITPTDIQKAVENLRSYAGLYPPIDEVRRKLREASSKGIDIRDLEAQLPELEKKARRREAEQNLSDLRDFVEGHPSPYTDIDSGFIDMHEALREATAIGVDVNDLRGQLLELEKMAIQSPPGPITEA